MSLTIASPIATRELRQAARQKRGPILLGALGTVAPLLAMLFASMMSSPWETPASIGRFVFEAMVTLALFAVVLVGVTCAANSVASEREGHTWEALLLSGLGRSSIVRGKFLGAFAQAALYALALAPSMGLSFLIGGVTVTEIVIAFGLVLAVGAVAVLFGLAVSSFARTARGALAGALVATLIVFPMIYGLFVGLGFGVASIMGDSDARGATWLAHAIVSAPFGARSFVFFALDPLLVLAVPAWLVYEVTKANVSDPSDDRSTGLRRWYVFSTLLLLGGSIATLFAVPDQRDTHEMLGVGLLAMMALHLGFSSLVFGGEPLGPSRRVAARGVRFIGIVPATVLHAALGTLVLGVIYGLLGITTDKSEHAAIVFACARYGIVFHLFIAGATGVFAARFQRANLVRGIIVAITLVLTVLPLVVGSIGKALTGGQGWGLVEAMSPLFPVVMTSRSFLEPSSVGESWVATILYGITGVMLVVGTWVARERARSNRGSTPAMANR